MAIKLTDEAKKRIIDELERFDPVDFSGMFCSVSRVIGFDAQGAEAQLKLKVILDADDFDYLSRGDYSLKLLE